VILIIRRINPVSCLLNNEDLSPLPLPLSCKERGEILSLPY